MEWFKKNRKIVIGVLIVVVISCIGLGAYLVSGNKEPKKANKENTEKTVEKQEDSEEVQDEEQVTENIDTDTVLDESTQTETDEVVEEEVKNETTVTQSTQSGNSGNTNNKGNSSNKNTTTTNKNTNSGSTTNNGNSGNTTNNGNSGSTNNSGLTTGKPSDGLTWMGGPLLPQQAAAIDAGYYNVVVTSYGYSLVVPQFKQDGSFDEEAKRKGYEIMYDYLESLGYERAGVGSCPITDDYVGIYASYENLHKVPTEDDIVWD